MPHPYLYFSKNNILSYREKIKTDETLKAKYLETIKDAPELLNEEFVSEDHANGRNSLHGNFWDLGRQTNIMTKALGTKYLVDGDIECAEKLKKLIKHFTGFERWYAESYKKRTPVPWHADLCSTGMTLAIATAYDMIYDFLSEEERKGFAKRIFELGVKPALSDWAFPETRIHAVDSMGHNWWAVCIAEPATALLSLKDNLPDEDVSGILDCVNHALASYFDYQGNTLFNKYRNYDDGGLFYESIGYFEYGTATPLRYLWCYERYFGENKVLRSALPKNMADALMSFSYPYSENGKTKFAFMNFGDSDFFDDKQFITKFLRRNNLSSPALNALSKNYTTDVWDDIEGYTADSGEADLNALRKTNYFPSGYVITRDSWNEDGTMFAVKSGYCWNHSHNDSGTFNIVYKGSPFILDSGRCDYDDKLYHAYYCQDDAHNVIRIGEKGRRHEELYRGTKFNGKIIDSYESNDFLFIQADCTGPMAHLCSRLYRNYFWLDNSTLVLFDEAYCHEENTAEFTLHYAGNCIKDGNRYLISDGERKATLTSVFPEGMIYSEKDGHPDHKPDEIIPYLELKTPTEERKHLLIHALELGEGKSEISHLSGKNYDGIKITKGSKERRIIFNHMADGHIMHDNSNNIIEGYDTDAYILMFDDDKETETRKIFMVCGSYLRKDGKPVFASFTKKTFCDSI